MINEDFDMDWEALGYVWDHKMTYASGSNDPILRYSVVLFGVKHVVAQAFPDGSDTFVCIDYDEANYEEYA